MDLTLIIEDATANPIKFTLDGAPVDKRARFDQQRYGQANHTTVDPDKTYQQKFEKTDSVRIQFYSNFPLNKVSIVDCEDQQFGADMFPAVAVEYRNKFFRAECTFSSIDGMLFIYFTEGLIYLDEDFTVPGELTAWNGRLPNINAVPGDIVRYSLNGVDFSEGIITEIKWNPALQAEGYLMDVPITLITPVDGLMEVNYDEKPANLYALQFSFGSLAPGKYFIRREHGVIGYDVSFTSEPLDIQESHEETLALEYRHDGTYNRADLWNYVYLGSWTNVIRIPAAFYKFTPAGEMDVDTSDNGVPRILRAVPYRQIELNFFNMPSWLADKIQMALAHDQKIINGYQWEVENFGQFETLDRLDLGTYVIVLRQKDDRAKKVDDFTYSLSAEFVPDQHLGLPYAGGSVLSTFITNTPYEFHFLSTGWVTPDMATFVNGDEITFTFPGVGTIPRTIVLQAVCEVNGLVAEITFTQVGSPPPAAYLDVSSLSVILAYPAGSNQLLNVSSSGDWDMAWIDPGYHFDGAKESGFSQVRISSPVINDTGTNRVGALRLSLQSNPAIYKDIDITQLPAPPPPAQLISVLPTLWNSPNRYATRNFLVDTEPGCKWQVYTSHEWIHCSTVIHTGDATINVQLDEADFYEVPREGSVTLVNILDPYDTIVIPIEQS
jgi:hypothetical protein